MKHTAEMPEPKIEVVVELLKEMVDREYGTKLAVIFVEGGDFESYRKAISKIEALPIHQRRATVVWVCLEDAELLRYPFLNVEFNRREGAEKLGITGQPEKITKVMRLIGGKPTQHIE